MAADYDDEFDEYDDDEVEEPAGTPSTSKLLPSSKDQQETSNNPEEERQAEMNALAERVLLDLENMELSEACDPGRQKGVILGELETLKSEKVQLSMSVRLLERHKRMLERQVYMILSVDRLACIMERIYPIRWCMYIYIYI